MTLTLHVTEPGPEWTKDEIVNRVGFAVPIVRGPDGVELTLDASGSDGDATTWLFEFRRRQEASRFWICMFLVSPANAPRRFAPSAEAYFPGDPPDELIATMLTGTRAFLRLISDGIWDVETFVVERVTL